MGTTRCSGDRARGPYDPWEQLAQRYRWRMVRQAMTIVRDWHEAEDIAQSVLARLWRRRSRLASIRRLDVYLMKAVRNEGRNYLRARRFDASRIDLGALGEGELGGHDPSPTRSLERAETRRLLARLEAELTPAQRAVFRQLRDGSGRSARQVGRRLGCSHRNVLKLIRRIRRIAGRHFPDLR